MLIITYAQQGPCMTRPMLNKARVQQGPNLDVTDDMRKSDIQWYTPTWHQVGDILLSMRRMSVMLIGYIWPEYTRNLKQRVLRYQLSSFTSFMVLLNECS